MRPFIFILLGLNIWVFTQLQGWTPNLLEDAPEPQRMKKQLAPAIARPVSLDAAGNTSSTLPPPAPPPTECFDVGPLTAAEAEALQANIARADRELKIEATQIDDGVAYMVMTSVHSSLREAQRREQQLRNLSGVRETYSILEGPLKNAVSLGIFNNKESAETLAGSLKARGADDISVVPRPNPPKAGVRIADVPKSKVEATRQLLLQLPVRACLQK
jgi:hypothetical protein